MNNKVGQIFRLLWRGLFLEVDAYDEASEGDNPFVEGLFIVVLVGLVIAVAGIIGSIFNWAVTPDLSQIKDIVLEGLQAMPWFEFMRQNPEALKQFNQQYEMNWQIANFVNPTPGSAIPNLVLTPLSLIISWLWFALISQAFARLLGGNGETKQNLGATALAVAPALLNVFSLLPTVTVAAVSAWTLLARYVAVRRVHENLSWARVLIAVVAPSVVLFVLFMLLGIVATIIFGSIIGGLAS